jgi:hypothetical protein
VKKWLTDNRNLNLKVLKQKEGLSLLFVLSLSFLNMENYILSNILTDQDVDRLTSILAYKKDLEFFKLETRERFNKIDKILDKIDKKFNDLNDTIMDHDKRI